VYLERSRSFCQSINKDVWVLSYYFICWSMGLREVISYSFISKSIGIKRCYILASTLGLSLLQIELDSKLVAEAVMDTSNNQSEFDNILVNYRSPLQQFPNFKIRIVKTQANYVAHTLAIVSNLYVSHHVFDFFVYKG